VIDLCSMALRHQIRVRAGWGSDTSFVSSDHLLQKAIRKPPGVHQVLESRRVDGEPRGRMSKPLASKTRNRLDIQGFDNVPDEILVEVVPWQRLAFASVRRRSCGCWRLLQHLLRYSRSILSTSSTTT